MSRRWRLLILLSLLPAGTAAAGQAPREFLEYGEGLTGNIIASMIPQDVRGSAEEPAWQHAFSNVVRGEYAIDEFVPAGDSIDSWTRMFTQQNLRRKRSSPASATRMMADLRTIMEKRCPQVSWSIIRESDADVVYEFRIADCAGQADQHEIARILYGKWNIWRLAYTEKRPQIDEATRQQWITALNAPKIVRQ